MPDWDRVFAVNVRGLFQVTRACVPLLRAAPHPAIVNSASIVGLRPVRSRSLRRLQGRRDQLDQDPGRSARPADPGERGRSRLDGGRVDASAPRRELRPAHAAPGPDDAARPVRDGGRRGRHDRLPGDVESVRDRGSGSRRRRVQRDDLTGRRRGAASPSSWRAPAAPAGARTGYPDRAAPSARSWAAAAALAVAAASALGRHLVEFGGRQHRGFPVGQRQPVRAGQPLQEQRPVVRLRQVAAVGDRPVVAQDDGAAAVQRLDGGRGQPRRPEPHVGRDPDRAAQPGDRVVDGRELRARRDRAMTSGECVCTTAAAPVAA